jgi:hypothetical protein
MRGGTREGSRRWESERGERGCLKRPRIYARIGQVFNEFLNVVNDAAAPMGDNGVCDVCDVCVCVYSLSLSLSLILSLSPVAANLCYATRGEFLSRHFNVVL